MINGAVYKDGKVAMRYSQPIPKFIKVGDAEYYFDCKFGVSLAFVDENKVQQLLDAKLGCNCGGNKRQMITLASEAVYKHWLDGQGGR